MLQIACDQTRSSSKEYSPEDRFQKGAFRRASPFISAQQIFVATHHPGALLSRRILKPYLSYDIVKLRELSKILSAFLFLVYRSFSRSWSSTPSGCNAAGLC